MFESKYSKVLTVILIIVIIAIVSLLGFLTFDYIQKFSISKQASDFVDSFQSGVTSENTIIGNISNNNKVNDVIEGNLTLNSNEIIGNTNTNVNSNTNTNTNSSSNTKKKYKGFTAVGTMKIPSINFEYPILEEITTKALETAVVALYPSGDNLNKPGNTVIIGHNYRNGLFFSNLKKITKGAKIYVTDYQGKSITYEVYNKFEASHTDTSFYSRDTNGLAELTLSTCTDASNDQRTIVFAKQI